MVITEIPYTMIGANIGKFLNDVYGLVESKATSDITDITNQSSKEGIRIVLELKKGADIEALENLLYKKTKLEDTFGVNMLAVADGRPETMGVVPIIRHHVKFQYEIATRKYQTLLAKEQDKKEIQEGLIRACNVIDLIIEILRGSRSIKDAKACLTDGNTDHITFKNPSSKIMAQQLNFMRIYKTKNYDEMSRKAANIISAQMILKPESVLGLATGSSPIGTYKQLINWYKKGDLDFSQIHSINLDEYKGLDASNSESYAYFMRHNLFDHVNIKPENTYIPNGMEEDVDKECTRYNSIIHQLGGIDLQLLGIGNNGHIGFNEPSDTFAKETHCVELTKTTIQANARFFDSIDEVPTHAYTTGIKNIMEAKHILLIANGEGKADALYQSLFGPITPQVPASILQLHDDVSIVADEAALSRIIEKNLI